MKKIIIFGSSGNVGSYVTNYAQNFFKNTEFEIIASGRRETNVFNNMGIEYISVDINKAEDFDKLPQEDVYAVILLSAVIPSYMDEYMPEKYLKTNILGTYNVLEYCRKVKADRILFSTTVFDLYQYAKEGKVLYPDLPAKFDYTGDHAVYVISKNTAIELIEHYHQEYGLKKFIFRFPTIYCYSAYQYYYPRGVKTLRPLYQQIENAKQGKPLEIWGNPEYSKDMVHVYDCAQMLCKAISVNKQEGIYNVGTGIPVTLKEQCEAIIEVYSPKENPSEIIYSPGVSNGGGFLMNVDNAKEDLGYEPKYDVVALFEQFKEEEKINTFLNLRKTDSERL